jgi:23S rRNA pseudouridine1911/1915/1917 synthase
VTKPTEKPGASTLQGSLVVPRELAGMPLDRFLSVSFPEADRAQLRRLVREGKVLVNGVPMSVPRPLRRNAVVTVQSEIDAVAYAPAEPPPSVEVLYEDADAMVVSKLVGAAIDLEPARLGAEIPRGEHLRAAYRLDREASGAVLLTKTLAAQRAVERQLDDGTAELELLAFVEGHPHDDVYEVSLALGADRRRSGRKVADPKSKERCITRFEVLARFDGCAIVAARPLTQRTHQVRVHLAEAGTPLLVDPVYGRRAELMLSTLKRGYRGKPGRPERAILSRLSLHARRVAFTTASRGRVQVEAPLPPDLERLMRVLDHYLGADRPPRNGSEHA